MVSVYFIYFYDQQITIFRSNFLKKMNDIWCRTNLKFFFIYQMRANYEYEEPEWSFRHFYHFAVVNLNFFAKAKTLSPSSSFYFFFSLQWFHKDFIMLVCPFQVTDSIDFPLFDIWFEPDCSKSNWVLESYGKTVLLISENIGYGCFFWKKPEPPIIELTDWNGDLFGYFVPGNISFSIIWFY